MVHNQCGVVLTNICWKSLSGAQSLFFMSNGPGYMEPGFEIDERLRSPTCQAARSKFKNWDPEGMDQFKPERWLVRKDGKEEFDSQAGPAKTFGLGSRGCYGKRLAYLEMRLLLILTTMNFELLEMPQKLASWDAIDGITHKPKQCYIRLREIRKTA